MELRNGGESFGRLSQGQYGGRRGSPRILRILERHGVKATFFMPAVVAMINPSEPRAVVDAGHEIAIHSWIHELNSKLSYAERDLAFRAQDTLRETVGTAARWDAHCLLGLQPVDSKDCSGNGPLYDSSLMADDEPYELLEHDEPTGVVELPVEWIRDDAVYFNMDRFSGLRPYTAPEAVLSIFQRSSKRPTRGGLFSFDDAPPSHRAPLADLDSGGDNPHGQGQAGYLDRNPRRNSAVLR